MLTCEISINGSQSYDVCVVPHWDVSSSVVEAYNRPAAALGRHAEIAWYSAKRGGRASATRQAIIERRRRQFPPRHRVQGDVMSTQSLLHLALPTPRLPERTRSALRSGLFSLIFHASAAATFTLLTLEAPHVARSDVASHEPTSPQIRRLVFLQSPERTRHRHRFRNRSRIGHRIGWRIRWGYAPARQRHHWANAGETSLTSLCSRRTGAEESRAP